jgi:hypothetical protein
VLDTTICKQTQITSIRHTPSYEQLEVKTNRKSFLCETRKGHNNTKTQNIKTHNRTKQKTKNMSSTDPTKKIITTRINFAPVDSYTLLVYSNDYSCIILTNFQRILDKTINTFDKLKIYLDILMP